MGRPACVSVCAHSAHTHRHMLLRCVYSSLNTCSSCRLHYHRISDTSSSVFTQLEFSLPLSYHHIIHSAPHSPKWCCWSLLCLLYTDLLLYWTLNPPPLTLTKKYFAGSPMWGFKHMTTWDRRTDQAELISWTAPHLHVTLVAISTTCTHFLPPFSFSCSSNYTRSQQEAVYPTRSPLLYRVYGAATDGRVTGRYLFMPCDIEEIIAFPKFIQISQ